jgi:hypothetical protein
VTTFWYTEQAGALNGNVSRTLKVNFTYAANRDVASRTATVSTQQGPEVTAKLPVTPQNIFAATRCTAGCDEERSACKVMCAEAQFDENRRNVWGRSMQRCVSGCIPARCGGS